MRLMNKTYSQLSVITIEVYSPPLPSNGFI